MRNQQAVSHRDHGRNPPRVGLNTPRQLPHPARREARVAALENAPAPQHVVDQEQSTRSQLGHDDVERLDRKSTRLNSSHLVISYAVFCLKKKKNKRTITSDLQWSTKSRALSRHPTAVPRQKI